MISTTTIILEYVCPAMALLVMQATWIAPWKAVEKATLDGKLGSLNPMPWVFMLDTTIGCE